MVFNFQVVSQHHYIQTPQHGLRALLAPAFLISCHSWAKQNFSCCVGLPRQQEAGSEPRQGALKPTRDTGTLYHLSVMSGLSKACDAKKKTGLKVSRGRDRWQVTQEPKLAEYPLGLISKERKV